jgi:hypothetical protein
VRDVTHSESEEGYDPRSRLRPGRPTRDTAKELRGRILELQASYC